MSHRLAEKRPQPLAITATTCAATLALAWIMSFGTGVPATGRLRTVAARNAGTIAGAGWPAVALPTLPPLPWPLSTTTVPSTTTVATSTTLAGLAKGSSGDCMSLPCAGIEVDATRAIAPLTHAASGFLHATAGVPPNALSATMPTSWRVDANETASGSIDTSAFDTARSAGAAVTVLMSDAWFGATSGGCAAPTPLCGARTPWSDLAGYSAWVRNYVQAIEATGRRPDYWDVQNEPDGEWSPGDYFNAVDALTVNATNEMAQFAAAYQAVKSVDPTAKLVGPSLSQFLTRPDAQDHYVDLSAFISYSAQHGLQWSAITWHENSADSPGELPNVQISNHVAAARALLASHPELGSPAIALTEYGRRETSVIPGWTLGEIAAVEANGIAWADHTCWDTASDPTVTNGCFRTPSVLDGVLLGNGMPTADYWVHQAYAAMAGNRVPTSSPDPAVSALAAAGTNQISIMVGRHASCTPAVNPDCQSSPTATPPPLDVPLHVVVPWAGLTSIVVDRVPNLRGPITAPFPVLATTTMVTGGQTVSVLLPAFNDGDVFTVVLQRSG